MNKTAFALLLSLGSVFFGCGGVVSTETSSGDAGSDDTTETTTDSSGGSGGSDTGGSGGATTTDTSSGGSGGGIILQPLTFEMSVPGKGRIVLGGDSEWQSFGTYTVTNPNNIPITIDSTTLMQVSDGGHAVDFVKVGVNTGPNVLGEGTLAFDTQTSLLDLNQNPLVIPANGTSTLEMLGKMANVQSSAECASWVNCPRSGHSPVLAVTQITVKEGPISATFINTPPVRVLHKARPIVDFLPINEPLHDGLNTIAKVKISTDPGHTITLRQLTLEFQPSPELTVDVDGINPWKVDDNETSNDVCTAVYAPAGFAQFCRGDGDQYISNQASTFELRVNVSGVVSGSSIKTELFQYMNEKAVNPLSLTDMNGGPGAIGFLEGHVLGAIDPNAYVSSSLLWSDLSEGVNHNTNFPTSYDVFTKAYVSGVDGFSLVTTP